MQLLNGPWQMAIDPQNVGKADKWFAAEPPEGARDAHVPGAIQESFPGYYGVAWYWHRFTPWAVPDDIQLAHVHFHGLTKYLAEAWLNGEYLGGYEGGDAPFDLDATGALKREGENTLVVRVVNPGTERVDGMVLAEVTQCGDYGGLFLPVEYRLVPGVRTVDLFARPNVRDGSVPLTVTVRNDALVAVSCTLTAQIGAALPAGQAVEDSTVATLVLAPGEHEVELTLHIAQPHLWNLDDPYLYRASVRLEASLGGRQVSDVYGVRCGFRELKVERGFFRLNGKRIILRSTHTGNHVPYSQGSTARLDLMRLDMIYAKACGFNTVRYLKGPAVPEQLDLCDELGLMAYEETGASWLINDSPHMGPRFDHALEALIRRDRNRPCVTIWGLLNETREGPIFRHAVGYLPRLRQLDPTRLVLLSSGRWDGVPSVGSLANPGSNHWECEWGDEGPDGAPRPFAAPFYRPPAYMDGMGDAHVYPVTPHDARDIHFLRTLGQDSKPVFLSEYGIGSMMNVARESRRFEQDRARPDLADVAAIRGWEENLEADCERWGLRGVYPFVEDLLRDSARLHSRQRAFGFDLVRSNAQLCGFNVTGILDHGLTGEGLWTFNREWKPGIVEALSDGWAPVRWCPFVTPMHGYVGRNLHVELVLANEDVLPAGDYPVTVRIVGAGGIVWEKRLMLRLPEPPVGNDAPLAVPVLDEEIELHVPAGAYELAAYMERGGAPAGGRLKFYLSDSTDLPAMDTRVAAWGLEPSAVAWLMAHGVRVQPWTLTDAAAGSVVLVGNPPATESDPAHWRALTSQVAQGSVAVFLDPKAFMCGEDSTRWLPLDKKGRCYRFNDWLYHKECVAKAHPIFAGLQAKGIMDWEYYGPVIPHDLFTGQDAPDETVAAAFAAGYLPGGYHSGILMGVYRLGAGQFAVNTLPILPNLDAHPAADRLLLNLIGDALGRVAAAPAPLPADWEVTLARIGLV